MHKYRLQKGEEYVCSICGQHLYEDDRCFVSETDPDLDCGIACGEECKAEWEKDRLPKDIDRYKLAGEIAHNFVFSDAQLTIAVEAIRDVIAYLSARTDSSIIVASLRQDFKKYRGLLRERGLSYPDEP